MPPKEVTLKSYGNKTRGWFLLLLLSSTLALLGLLGCGYQLSGGGQLPGGIGRLNIAVLENRSAETGYESVMTNALVNEFVRHSDLELAAAKRADGFLGGVIESVGVQTISRTSLSTSLERQVVVLVRLTLTAADGRTLWSSRFSDTEAYTVAEQKRVTLDNRRQALAILSGRMAEKMFYAATSEF